MRYPKNQPIQFDGDIDNPFVESIKYKQKIQQDDETQFQFEFESSRYTENISLNGDFSNGLEYWYNYMSGGWFHTTDAVTGEKWIECTNAAGGINNWVIRGGSKYTVKLTIREIVYGMTLQIYFGTKLVKTITEAMGSGTYVFDAEPIVASGLVAFKLVAVPAMGSGGTPTGRVKVDNVNITERFGVELNSFFGIYEMDGTYVTKVNVLGNALTTGGTLGSSMQFADNMFTATIDWSALSLDNGCYKIGVSDADVNQYSQNFCANSEFKRTGDFKVWTLANVNNGVTTIANDVLHFIASGAGDNGSATQTGAILAGKTYSWAMNIISINANVTVTVNFGGTSVAYTASGTKTGNAIVAANGNFSISFAGAGSGECEIEYFRCQADATSLTPDYYSNPFSLQTTWDRTVLINAFNSQNAFGLNFQTHTFSPRIRVRGWFLPADTPYIIKKSDEELWDGRKSNFYYKRRKHRVLAIEQEPEFVHDFLSLLLGYDHFYVDSTEYFISEEEYAVAWNKFRVLGGVNLLLEEKQQQVRKTRKQADTGSFVLDATENVVTDPLGWILTVPTLSPTGRPESVNGLPSTGESFVNNNVENQ